MTTSIFKITRRLTYTKTLDIIQKLINKCVHVGDPIILPAGTATTPPLKFTEGVLNTTPQEGAAEFTDGHLYFSPVDGERQGHSLTNNILTSTVTVTNTTVETTVFSWTIAANTLHAHQVVELLAVGSLTNAAAADDFTIRLKIDGVTVRTLSRIGGKVTDAGWEIIGDFTIRSIGVSGTLVDFFKYIEGGLTPLSSSGSATTAIDTTASHTISFTIQWNNAKAGNIFSVTQGHVTLKH